MYKIIGWLFIALSGFIIIKSISNIADYPEGVFMDILPSMIPRIIFTVIILYVGYRLVRKRKVKVLR